MPGPVENEHKFSVNNKPTNQQTEMLGNSEKFTPSCARKLDAIYSQPIFYLKLLEFLVIKLCFPVAVFVVQELDMSGPCILSILNELLAGEEWIFK